MDEDDRTGERIAARLEVVEAILWASENAAEVLSIASQATTRAEALRSLTSPPYSWTEFQAHHMLDMTFARLSQVAVEAMRQERNRLLRGEDTSGDHA